MYQKVSTMADATNPVDSPAVEAWVSAVKDISHTSDASSDLQSGRQVKAVPRIELIPGFQQTCLVIIGLGFTSWNSTDTVGWFHPEASGKAPEELVYTAELNLSRTVRTFLDGCFLDSYQSHLGHSLKRLSDQNPMNWSDHCGRVGESFSRPLVSPDIKFSLQVFTENDLDKFPAIVLHDLEVHSQSVYRFDGVRSREFLENSVYSIPGSRKSHPEEEDAGCEDSHEDSDASAAQKPWVVSVLWVVGSRDGIQVLWIFRHKKVYEVGDQRWVEYERREFVE
jgi:hypothetical protein